MDIEQIRKRAEIALGPLKQVELDAVIYQQLYMKGKRTSAGRTLPPYYLVYFLLVDLLGFRNDGKSDKTAWSITVEHEGTPFLIEHRKFGLGIFGIAGADTEAIAGQVAICIHRAVKAARPYFDWRAEDAASQSHLNVVNRSRELFEHFQFHLGLYDERSTEAESRKAEVVKTEIRTDAWSIQRPSFRLRREARHFAIAAIEGFFSWTEHVFIHIAILRGKLTTGREVGDLAKADWVEKYKAALDLTDAENKKFYDELTDLRRQLRNFVAHGSFGKDGEAFQFHSGAGAVPMLLPHKQSKTAYRFGLGLEFRPEPSIALIKTFIDHLWSGERTPAEIYIQRYSLPAILTHVSDGTYLKAMRSDAAMDSFAEYLASRFDAAIDMDF